MFDSCLVCKGQSVCRDKVNVYCPGLQFLYAAWSGKAFPGEAQRDGKTPLGSTWACWLYEQKMSAVAFSPGVHSLWTAPPQRPFLLRLAKPAFLTQLYTISPGSLFICVVSLPPCSLYTENTPRPWNTAASPSQCSGHQFQLFSACGSEISLFPHVPNWSFRSQTVWG